MIRCMCVWSVSRKECDECLIEPVLYQSKYKVTIELSVLEKKSEQEPAQKCRASRTASCLDINYEEIYK